MRRLLPLALLFLTACDGCFSASVTLAITSVEPPAVFIEGGTLVTIRTTDACLPEALTATLSDLPITLTPAGPDAWTFEAPPRIRTEATPEPIVLTCATTADPSRFEYAPGGNVATAVLTYDPELEPIPTVTATTPTGDRASVIVRPSVTFDRGLDPESVTTTTIRIDGVEASVSWDAATRTATLVPSRRLSFATRYDVSIRGGVSGVRTLIAGKELAEDARFSFTTRARGDGDPWIGEIAAGAGTASSSGGSVTGVVAGSTPVGTSTATSGRYKLVGGFTFAPVDGTR